VRVAYLVLPLASACGASAVLVRAPFVSGSPVLLRWVAVLAICTAVLVAVHRSLVRLLPLAALLELSVQFPGPAPSRYAIARDAGNSGRLREIVARAQRGDLLVDLADVEAARDILALVAALRTHDSRTRGHSERVRVFTDLIADQLHIAGPDRDRLRWAALLHDVGKLNVPAAVLNKTDRLDESDWELIRGHPSAGAQLTVPLGEWLGGWAGTIAEHHEKYDGSGYPLGLSGDQICLGARIVAVADAFDVMTAARSYRRPIGREAALRELKDCSGSHFDPQTVRAMLAVSTPRLRWAMGPLSWLGAAPFLAATQGAASLAAQATAGALVAGTVVVAGPAAVAAPSPAAEPLATTTTTPHVVPASQAAPSGSQGPKPWSPATATGPSRSATAPTGKPASSGRPTAPPGQLAKTVKAVKAVKPVKPVKPVHTGHPGTPLANPTASGTLSHVAKISGHGRPKKA
jgi:putative nucleotidyltransferase with HDIG domain